MMRAISRLERPCSKCSRRTSWILRMDNLLLVKQPSGKYREVATVIPLPPAHSGRVKLSSLARNQCPVCAGTSVQFAVESVSSLARKTHLKLWIAKLRRMQFGRKSEKLDHQIEQLELQLEDLQADEGEVAKALPETDRTPRNKPVRKPLPEHLPRDEKVHLPAADACPS